jgi:dethiobiotin synthetase
VNAIFVTGTDTGVGKTIVSAILTKALGATYWKPIQSGDPDQTDTMLVQRLVGPELRFLPEAHIFKLPISPHASAAAEGLEIQPQRLIIPEVDNTLIIEGAGGVLVPLNEEDLYVDWVAAQGLPVILVSFNRLGSINHTLMSVEALLNRQIEVLGIIFNGEPAAESERYILQYTGLPCLARIPWNDHPDGAFVSQQAERIRSGLEGRLLFS